MQEKSNDIAKLLHISYTKKCMMFPDTSYTWYDNKVEKSNNINPSLPLSKKRIWKKHLSEIWRRFIWEVVKYLNSNIICNAFNTSIDHRIMR